MTVNSFIEAIAKRLGELFPGRLVYVDQIPAKAEGNHFIRCMEQGQSLGLGRQRRRAYSFEVVYFLQERENMAFHQWAEAMYQGFEALKVGEQLIRLKNLQAQPGDDMAFRFTFDANVYALLKKEPEEPMEAVDTRLIIKE